MKYTVQDVNGEELSIQGDGEYVALSTDHGDVFSLTLEEFQEFRKAVGYVWQEVHGND